MSLHQEHHSGIFIHNFEHISHLVLVFLNVFSVSSVSIVEFEQANASWGKYLWHKGLIKSFAFTGTFPRISAMRLSVTIHSLAFCKFYFLSNYGESENERKLNLEE